MRLPQISLLLLGLVLLAVMAGCSGGSASITAPQTTVGAETTDDSQTTYAASPAPTSGVLPSIPLDDGRAVSAADGEGPPPERIVVAGTDFVQQYSGEVQDGGLRLDPAIAAGDLPVAWGMYRVDGLAGKRPLGMIVAALPDTPRQQYFVGVADYSQGNWDWFGPSSLPELEVNLRESRGRYVSAAGSMYFLVVVHGANAVLHSQTTVIVGNLDGRERPGLPVALRASDGELPDAIKVGWRAGQGAERFELFRAEVRRENDRPDWRSIAFTNEEHFLDRAVEPGKPYLYKVRALNANGDSIFSNVDVGFAGRPDGLGGAIHARVVAAGTENGMEGIHVAVIGAPGHDMLMKRTGPRGYVEFGPLPAGNYIVLAQAPSFDFAPKFLHIELNREHPEARVLFEASPEPKVGLLWGFAYAMGGPDAPGLHPLEGVDIIVKPRGGERFVVQTGPRGFWAARGLAPGEYAVHATKDGFVFRPRDHFARLDGEHAAPALVFHGLPHREGGDGGGGGNDDQE